MAYEIFLAWHVVLSFAVLIGCYYHVVMCFGHQWGYETWPLIAFACWAFERLARIVRFARNGVKTGRVTIIDEDYIRLDIPGVSASGQAYLYFPTLTWRVWENHPFSVAATLLAKDAATSQQRQQSVQSTVPMDEKLPVTETKPVETPSSSLPPRPQALQVGLSFFIRTHTGMTSKLRTRTTLPVLVESSYGHNIFGDHGGADLASYPNLVCIVGGVGITAIISFLAHHNGRIKLYWCVRNSALVDAMHDTLAEVTSARTDIEIVKGERLDLHSIVEREISADAGTGTAVVVCGPSGMADNVRVLVSKFAAKDKTAVVALVEESYSW